MKSKCLVSFLMSLYIVANKIIDTYMHVILCTYCVHMREEDIESKNVQSILRD